MKARRPVKPDLQQTYKALAADSLQGPLRQERCARCWGAGSIAYIEGAALRIQRMGRQVSLRRLGAAMGLTASYLHDLEHNRRPCKLELARRYIKALDKL